MNDNLSKKINVIVVSDNREKYLRCIAAVMYIVMTALHVRLILSFDGLQIGDAPEYIRLGLRTAYESHFYPMASDFVGNRYIHNPGYINYLGLLFSITKNVRIVFWSNLVMAQIMLFSTRYIVGVMSNSKICKYAYQILFCAYFSLGIAGGIVSANVEYVFCGLMFASMALFVTDNSILWCVSGIVLAISNYVRPVMVFVIPALLVSLFCLKLKDKVKRSIMFGVGLLVTIIIIAGTSYAQCGRPIYQATTMWNGLLIGNNPIADGNNTYVVFEEGNYGYVAPDVGKNWTCDDYEAHSKQLVIEWVKENPWKAIALVPRRFFYLWGIDTCFISAYSDNIEPTDKAEYLITIVNTVIRCKVFELTSTQMMTLVSQIFYMLILAMGIIAAVLQIKRRMVVPYLGLYTFVILGIGSLMIMFGCARYHFAYIIAIMMLIPSIISNFEESDGGGLRQ